MKLKTKTLPDIYSHPASNTNLKRTPLEEFKDIMDNNDIDDSMPTYDQLKMIVLQLHILSIKKLKSISMVYRRTKPDATYSLTNLVTQPYDFCGLRQQLLSFKKCEQIEQSLALPIATELKAKSLLTWLFLSNHTLYLEGHKGVACRHDICEQYQAAYCHNEYVSDHLKKINVGRLTYCIPREISDVEDDLRQLLKDIMTEPIDHLVISPDELLELRQHCYTYLTDEQLTAISLVINSGRLVCLTGYPGTGKSTITGCLSRFYSQHNAHMIFTALSGMAVSNMIKIIGNNIDLDQHHVGTITKLFMHSMPPKNKVSDHHKNDVNQHKTQPKIVIVDEASMVDYMSFKKILTYVKKHHCKLILVGDHEQLPPIGIGQLFRDIIERQLCPVAKLETIMRQKDDCLLLTTIKQISKQQLDLRTCFNQSDCQLISVEDQHIYAQLTNVLNQNRWNYMTTMIITAQNKGDYGVDKLNGFLQKHYNQCAKDVLLPKTHYEYSLYEGDQLQRLVNNYGDMNDDSPYELSSHCKDRIQYNGDFYILNRSGVDFKVRRREDGETFVCDSSDLKDEFMLGYATTVHKLQGSSKANVIIILPYAHRFMWTQIGRKLLYTAMSRAKNNCVIIGSQELLMQAYHIDKHIVTGFNLAKKVPTS